MTAGTSNRVAAGKTKWGLVIEKDLLEAADRAASLLRFASLSDYVRHAVLDSLPADIRTDLESGEIRAFVEAREAGTTQD